MGDQDSDLYKTNKLKESACLSKNIKFEFIIMN